MNAVDASMPTRRLLLCTDLDRTLVPNGYEPESPDSRDLFTRLVAAKEITLAYVSGRDQALVDEAIADYELPQPDFVITDVGTRIAAHGPDGWRALPEWAADIATSWAGHDHAALRRLFDDIEPLRLQEAAKQNVHKLSYYLPANANRQELEEQMQGRLAGVGVRASLVWSIDDLSGVGLLDVLPERASKLHAIDFIRQRLGFAVEETLFAGDSGNDLIVMESAVPSVLVANAAQAVRAEAVRRASAMGNERALYLARGGYLGMNGNYSAGILEGVNYFYPEFAAGLATVSRLDK